MKSTPIILVPGFWLGAWAWDEVASFLRADGHDVTAITLPGLESADADRSSVSFEDHVNAIVEAVTAAPEPVVLAVHSATGFSGYAASDRVPERIAAIVYVDTAPGIPPLDPAFSDDEKPMVWEEIEAEENLDGLSEEQKETFRQRAVPGGDAAAYVRNSLSRNDSRLVVRALVDAPLEEVAPRTGQWAKVTAVDASSCRIEMDAVDPRWAAFGLGVIGAPVTLEEATPELRALLTDWSARFTTAV